MYEILFTPYPNNFWFFSLLGCFSSCFLLRIPELEKRLNIIENQNIEFTKNYSEFQLFNITLKQIQSEVDGIKKVQNQQSSSSYCRITQNKWF